MTRRDIVLRAYAHLQRAVNQMGRGALGDEGAQQSMVQASLAISAALALPDGFNGPPLPLRAQWLADRAGRSVRAARRALNAFQRTTALDMGRQAAQALAGALQLA